jgi:hypothetical protein
MCSRATSRVEFLVGIETVPQEMNCVDVGHDKAMQCGGALVVTKAPDDKTLDMMRSFKGLSSEALLEKFNVQLLKKFGPPR